MNREFPNALICRKVEIPETCDCCSLAVQARVIFERADGSHRLLFLCWLCVDEVLLISEAREEKDAAVYVESLWNSDLLPS